MTHALADLQALWDAEAAAPYQLPYRTGRNDPSQRYSSPTADRGEESANSFSTFDWCLIAYMAGITTGGILYQCGVIL